MNNESNDLNDNSNQTYYDLITDEQYVDSSSEININPEKIYYGLKYNEKALNSASELINSFNDIDDSLASDVNFDVSSFKKDSNNIKENLQELYNRINKTKDILINLDPSILILFNHIDNELNYNYEEFGEDDENSKVNKQPFIEDSVYSSWFGVQNKQDYDFLFGVFDRNGNIGIKYKSHERSRNINSMTRSIPVIGKSLSDLNRSLNIKAGQINSYFASKGMRPLLNKGDNKDIFGAKVKYADTQIYTKTLWANNASVYDNFENPVTLDLGIGTASGSAGLLYGRTYGRAAVGIDHAYIDAALQVGVFNANGSVDVPIWTTESGQEIISASVDGNVSVLEAYAKARAGVGVYKDIDGNTHTELGVQLNAGADLAKASAGASVNVLGVEGKVSGSVKIGIGAQLDIGFMDGKLRANIGLAAGVGFDVGFELDFSGLWDNIKSAFSD